MNRQPTITPRGLSRIEAAHYIGVGTTKFDELVERGDMPQPRTIDARKVWDRVELDACFDNLPHSGEAELERNPYDGVAA